ncbi:MAG: TetR/AcrR family transcriptional regulator [Clostridium sp.]|nr:TetR/AcrR family transcriptional regulator [Clostridium sp.]
MPTGTFFRLSEEKKQRLIDAAWAEFTTTRFSDVSINQIIRTAQIPRGSFYQYFEDKEDLFLYLLDSLKCFFEEKLLQYLDRFQGDLFAVPLFAFDRLICRQGEPSLELIRFAQMVRINQGVSAQRFVCEKSELIPDTIRQRMDLSDFRRQDKEFLENAFFLVIVSLVHSVMETTRVPTDWKLHREELAVRIEIIRQGCLNCDRGCSAAEVKEEL